MKRTAQLGPGWKFLGANQDLKAVARRVYLRARKLGEIVPRPCAVCGDEPAVGHHEDYAKPLDVVWLCDLHHRWRHAYDNTVEAMQRQRAA